MHDDSQNGLYKLKAPNRKALQNGVLPWSLSESTGLWGRLHFEHGVQIFCNHLAQVGAGRRASAILVKAVLAYNYDELQFVSNRNTMRHLSCDCRFSKLA